jgi:hypothetical protein
MKDNRWIGVDFDRTLAFNDHHRGLDHTGEPIPAMVERVKRWHADGRDVRIFTARISHDNSPKRMAEAMVGRIAIEQWMKVHLGFVLPITNVKDWLMAEIWDDRAVQVIPNTGLSLEEVAEYTHSDVDRMITEIGRLTVENAQLRHERKSLIEQAELLTGRDDLRRT